jgi:hypothetical protein
MQDQIPYSQNRALRLTLEYKDGQFTVLERHFLNKRAQSSDPLLDTQKDEQRSGFWIELRDGEGRAIYQQVLHNPIPVSVEIHSENRDRPIRRETNPNPQAVFSLLVPNLPEAETLVIVGSPLKAEAMFEPASDLAHFSLRDLREGK